MKTLKMKNRSLIWKAAGFILVCTLLSIPSIGQSTNYGDTDSRWGYFPDYGNDCCGQSSYQTPEEIVYGGEFLDRFLRMPQVGTQRSDIWGASWVLPRDPDNGIEDEEYSYWGGNIVIGDDGKNHLFVCRWPNDCVKDAASNLSGHDCWPQSIIVHAVSDDPMGPYEVIEEIGKGHNPEIYRKKDGTYVVGSMWYDAYTAPSINGPWNHIVPQFEDPDGRYANRTYAVRDNGDVIMMNKAGQIFINYDSDPIEDWTQLTIPTSYHRFPSENGTGVVKLEDPVIWRDEIQYHCVYHDWNSPMGLYMRSPDGINWTWMDGKAYQSNNMMNILGIDEDWFTFERPKVRQDRYGRATHMNWAVCDAEDKQDKAFDVHGSKNLIAPLTIQRRYIVQSPTTAINASTNEIVIKILAEEGFNPQTDIDLTSLKIGSPKTVNFGGGGTYKSSVASGNDLIITFNGAGNGITNDNFATKILGKTSDGKLLFGFSALVNGVPVNTLRFLDDSPTTQTPYGGSARSIPGRIEAEEYDNGGEGVAYHDNEANNAGANVMREDQGVDIEARDGGNSVGWTVAGEWLEYTVNATAGTYELKARVAAVAAGKTITVKLDDATLGVINVPNTGNWGTFQTVSLPNISVTGGSSKILRLELTTGATNLNWIEFTNGSSNDTQSPTVPTNLSSSNVIQTGCSLSWTASTDNVGVTGYDVSQGSSIVASVTTNSASISGLACGSSYTFTVRSKDAAGNTSNASSAVTVNTSTCGGNGISIPGTVQAENYSAMSGIQTETTSDAGGGQNVGWIGTGDWMDYLVNVQTAGTYMVNFRLASLSNNIMFDLKQGNTVLTSVNSATTNGWQTWTTVSKTVSLNAGEQTLRIAATGGGWNINWIEFIADNQPVTNLALNKTATQSSNYNNTLTANLAINGNINDFSHTANEANAWWQVDLGALADISTINVYNRANCCQSRLSNYHVFVSDVPFTSTALSTTINQSGVGNFYQSVAAGFPTTINANRTGRYVRIQLAGTNFLHIAEVEVNGALKSAIAPLADNKFDVQIYPNPVTDVLNVSISKVEGKALVTIINSTGAVVYKRDYMNGEPLHLSELTPGIYMLNVYANNAVATEMFIKQ